MMKRLSIVIVTYNSEKDIYDCLKSIWNNCDIPKDQLEICIVDNSLESDSMFRKLEYLYGYNEAGCLSYVLRSGYATSCQ